MVGIMFLLMFILIFIGLPVFLSILGSGIIFLLITDMKPLLLVSQRFITGLDSFPLLAIPLFVLVGEIMDKGGISKRMIHWADELIGWLPGGLGVVTIVSCAIFAALTGSGPATVAAIGSIMIPSLTKSGYDKKTAAGMVAAGGALGPIIPPSIPMIIYGVTMGISIPKMFIAGIIPGIVMMLFLILVNFVIIKNNPKIMENDRKKFNFTELIKSTWSALGALLLPIIILGGFTQGYLHLQRQLLLE
ncbi:C4-dicarboxylate TRAP-T family tripartite ATP-independent periplasmic transporter, membrane protein [Peptoniphilus indolicus ATCC 29427]|uniref:C4-dicarboxylate TRAP-T family tripartite ATP-independent periplasmic transporter, membrane protein n=1 Tax=Peptoniphilus indolicus ATCC 29427 TaxID=997350 RepID=G4D6X9_9FIRM|nr:C4-dicarboxylate TRAP-T family tripartite ATP-independent periplasmic transporter, membrane protein [Peptoniphilus indolicus ATCC 29427]